MVLEAVVFSPAAAGHFGYGRGDSPYALPWCDMGGLGDLCAGGYWDQELDDAWAAAPAVWDVDWAEAASRDDHSSDASSDRQQGKEAAPEPAPAVRRKRRRTKVVKNKEEIETQRMTHIAVERNRRRQMNEYLAVLRSHMPPSYAHRVRLRPVSSNLRSIDHCHSASTISIAHRYQLNSLVTFCNAVTAVLRFWFLFTG